MLDWETVDEVEDFDPILSEALQLDESMRTVDRSRFTSSQFEDPISDEEYARRIYYELRNNNDPDIKYVETRPLAGMGVDAAFDYWYNGAIDEEESTPPDPTLDNLPAVPHANRAGDRRGDSMCPDPWVRGTNDGGDEGRRGARPQSRDGECDTIAETRNLSGEGLQ